MRQTNTRLRNGTSARHHGGGWRFIKSAQLASAALVALVLVMPCALAQKPAGYPARLVRIIVPYSPGIGVDTVARVIAAKLAERSGQAVIVENKAGASGLIGTEMAARAAPDGHTLVMAVNTLVITASTRPVPFDPVRDFAPVIKIGTGAFLLTIHPSLPARDLNELIAHAKSRPGKVNYGSSGAGTPAHLATELLKQQAGIDLFHVPYKGLPPSVIGHVNGDVAVMIAPLEMVRPHIATGRVKAVAATGAQRSPLLPDLPTITELGYPNVSLDLWYGLLAPAGTPPAIIAWLNAEVGQLLGLAEIQEVLRKQSVVASPGTPVEFGALIRDDLAKWKKLAATTNIRFED